MNNPPAPLTLARLIELDACEPALDLFKSTFGDSVDMANLPEGYGALDFDWGWAARKLLDQPARADRDKISAAAWEDFDKTIAAAWADYDKTLAAAWADRDKSTAAAFVAGYVATFYRQHGDN